MKSDRSSPQHVAEDWRDYRNCRALTGRSAATGDRSRMNEQAEAHLGGGLQEVVEIPDGTSDLLFAWGGGIQRIALTGNYRWKTKPFGAHYITGIYDLDDDGELEIVTSNGRELLILSASNGRILWRYNVGLPLSYGTYATMFQVVKLFPDRRGMQVIVPCFSHKEVLLFSCEDGCSHTKLLHALWMDDGYHPTTCIGDVNRDGRAEIVIARLGGVYVFDPVSGKMLHETLWTSDTERRRNYGHFELADIDGDGDLEAIVLSDRVSRHIAVLDNDGTGRFTPLWDKFIQHIYPEDTTELRYVNNSLTDVNGDGLPEITVSIFNHRDDGRWWTEVIEASTGKSIYSIADRYLRGIQDVDGDGTGELLLTEASQRTVQPYGQVSIIKAQGAEANGAEANGADPRVTTLWQRPNVRFAERTIHTTPTRAQFKPDVFANDEVWFDKSTSSLLLFEETNSGARLLSLKTTDNFRETEVLDPVGRSSRVALSSALRTILSEPNGEIIAIDPKHGNKQLTRCGYHLTTEAHIAARPGPTPTVITRDGETTILVPSFDDHIVGFAINGGALLEKFRIEGRSRIGYDNVFHAASIIEIDVAEELDKHRVQREPRILVVDDGALPNARLSFYDLRGVRTRSLDFPDLPAHVAGSRIGIYDWIPFNHSTGPALMLSCFRSASMNSEYTRAISLRTGTTLWELAHSGEGEYGRGVGAWGAASRHIQEGKAEALLCAKDTILRIDLEHGTLTHEPRLLTEFTADAMKQLGIWKPQGLKTWSSIEDPFTAYGSIMLSDLNGDGSDELIAVGSFGGFGVLTDDMSALWWRVASFGDVLYRFPAVADVDHDGRLELVQGHSTGEIVVYNAVTGDVKHRIEIGAITTDCVTADINGDGVDECVCGTNDGRILVLGMRDGEFVIEREWQFEAGVGSPVVATLEGKASILAVTADGALRIIS